MPECADKSGMLLAAAAVSMALARGKTAEDIALLSAFLDVVADELALLSALQAKSSAAPPARPEKISQDPWC